MPTKKSSKLTKKTIKPDMDDAEKGEEIKGQEDKEQSKEINEEIPALESIKEPSIDTKAKESITEEDPEKKNEIGEVDELEEDEIDEIEEIEGMEEIKEENSINNIILDKELQKDLDLITPPEDIIEQSAESDDEKQPTLPSEFSPDEPKEQVIEANLTPNIEPSQMDQNQSNVDEDIEVSDEEITVIEEETIQTKKSGKKVSGKEDAGEKTVSVKELTEKSQIKNRIEAAMFIAGRPVSSEELSIKLDISKKQIEDLIKELALDYMDRITSIEIVQVGEKFSMQIKPEYTEHVKKFTTGGLIPEAVMRTLTIIALKQPISKSLVVKMRGAGAYDHIKFLIDRGFIQQSKKGRSMDLETSDQFSDTFGLSRDKKKLKEVLIQQLGIKSPVKSGDEEAEEQKARKEALNKKKEEGQPPAE